MILTAYTPKRRLWGREPARKPGASCRNLKEYVSSLRKKLRLYNLLCWVINLNCHIGGWFNLNWLNRLSFDWFIMDQFDLKAYSELL